MDFCDTVRSVLRPNDVLGRYGGEEFVVLLPETDSLLIRADKALYRAKGQGRDRIEVAQSN